jgi:hypothetical protein
MPRSLQAAGRTSTTIVYSDVGAVATVKGVGVGTGSGDGAAVGASATGAGLGAGVEGSGAARALVDARTTARVTERMWGTSAAVMPTRVVPVRTACAAATWLP